MHEIERIGNVSQIDERPQIEQSLTDAFSIDADQNYDRKRDDWNEIGHGICHDCYDESHSQKPNDILIQIPLTPTDAIEFVEQHAEKKTEKTTDEAIIIGYVQSVF